MNIHNEQPFKIVEIIIPTPYILNDNSMNNYKSNMGKMQWLEKQMHMAIGSEEATKDLICWVMQRKVSDKLIKDKNRLMLYLTHYKAKKGTIFDLANYERCYKPLIDALTGAGYFSDDNYRVVNPVVFIGGSNNEWKSDRQYGINEKESDHYDTVESYMHGMWPQVKKRMNNSKKHNKISNYDLFQIWVENRS